MAADEDGPWLKATELLETLVGVERQETLQAVLDQRLSSVTVVMDAPHDPHNGAAVLRSCDAFGVQDVHVVARTEPFRAAGVVSKGSQKWVDATSYSSVSAAVSALEGYELVGTHPQGTLQPEDLAAIPRLALVMGNEHDGICEELRAACKRSVQIPMKGFVESLNVSVSAAILLRYATAGRPGDLNPKQRMRLYTRWLMRSVNRAAEILAARDIALPEGFG